MLAEIPLLLLLLLLLLRTVPPCSTMSRQYFAKLLLAETRRSNPFRLLLLLLALLRALLVALTLPLMLPPCAWRDKRCPKRSYASSKCRFAVTAVEFVPPLLLWVRLFELLLHPLLLLATAWLLLLRLLPLPLLLLFVEFELELDRLEEEGCWELVLELELELEFEWDDLLPDNETDSSSAWPSKVLFKSILFVCLLLLLLTPNERRW